MAVGEAHLVAGRVDGEPEQRQLLGALALALGRMERQPKALVQVSDEAKPLRRVGLSRGPRPWWRRAVVINVADEGETRMP